MDQLDRRINTFDPNDPLILDRWNQWINALDPSDPLIQSHDTSLAGCALHTVKSFAPWLADLSTRLVTISIRCKLIKTILCIVFEFNNKNIIYLFLFNNRLAQKILFIDLIYIIS